MDVAEKEKVFNFKVHSKYFKRCLDVLPARYAYLDPIRLTFAFFGISGLELLDSLDLVKEQKGVIEWIYSLQILPNSTRTNLEKCGFVGSHLYGDRHLLQTFKESTSHITMTFSALLSLIILGDDLERIDKDAIATGVAALQLEDGSFAAHFGGSENDMRFIYCASVIFHILDDWSKIDVHRSVRYIKDSLTYEGAFAQGPGLEAHGGSTFCAVASLYLMNQLHVLSSKQYDNLQKWCLMRQEEGFQGRPNKPIDTCYSFWIGSTLKLLGFRDLIDHDKNRQFLSKTQSVIGGGFAKYEDANPDLLHSYFAISSLALSDEEGVIDMNPALNISSRAVKKLQVIQDKWMADSLQKQLNCFRLQLHDDYLRKELSEIINKENDILSVQQLKNICNVLISLKLLRKDNLIIKNEKELRKKALFALECLAINEIATFKDSDIINATNALLLLKLIGDDISQLKNRKFLKCFIDNSISNSSIKMIFYQTIIKKFIGSFSEADQNELTRLIKNNNYKQVFENCHTSENELRSANYILALAELSGIVNHFDDVSSKLIEFKNEDRSIASYFLTLSSVQILKGSLDILDKNQFKAKLLRLQNKVYGGFIQSIGKKPNSLDTLYGLSSISLLGCNEILQIDGTLLNQLIL
ncbi:DgyrCDS4851 [Dimorphilus gyrociliatus]|uniref:Geranylgeranyl transferase type-1 subunit beta n=1 Tax=Dimorphilus gyrociliatus TaxID=2664684 RepID=A0A7I8VIQ7_9ANNE|nr:DgyrCDS4851 [Dimorphilus gyrociliatus]